MFDTLIRNGLLVDGSGADAVPGDIALKDGVIVERSSMQRAASLRPAGSTCTRTTTAR